MSNRPGLFHKSHGPELGVHERLYNTVFLFGILGGISILLLCVIFGAPLFARIASVVFTAALVVTWPLYAKLQGSTAIENIINILVMLGFLALPVFYLSDVSVNLAMSAFFTLGIAITMFTFRNSKLGAYLGLIEALLFVILLYIADDTKHPFVLAGSRREAFIVLCIMIAGIVASVLCRAVFRILKYESSKAEYAIYEMSKRLEIDSLTGIYNRKYLYSRLEEIISQDRPVSIIMFDIDHFKYINDDYGHQAGDLTLKRISNILENHCSGSEFVARFGGEEFVLVLPDSSLSSATKKAEEIRVAIENSDILNFLDDCEYELTVSGGVATYKESSTLSDFISAADTNMYAAKALGRNRIFGGTEVGSYG